MKTVAIVLVLLACVPAHAGDETNRNAEVEALRKQVAAFEHVSGDQVYYGMIKGQFFVAYEKLRAFDDVLVFRSFLAEPSPVARAMGLYGLTQMQGERAVPELRKHLRDRARLDYFPYGCCGSTITVAEFVRTLLTDRDPLRHAAEESPLVGKQVLLGIDLGILAANELESLHFDAGILLNDALEAGMLNFTPQGLAALNRDLSPVEIVRAVGHMHSHREREAFLLQVLADEKVEAPVRLAAASALTRIGSAEAVRAIEKERSWLDRRPEGKLATRFLDVIRRYEAFYELWRPVDREGTWQGMEKIADQVTAAFTAEHPFALPKLGRATRLAIYSDSKHPEVGAAHAASLLRIARDLKRYTQSWNTWGTAPYELESLLIALKIQGRWPQRGRPRAEAREVERLLRPYLGS